MSQYVQISFDCLPLRTVTRRDIPLDASPAYQALCERILEALDSHGAHNTFFLYNAGCVFHLMNSEELGVLEFRFEGTVFTDAKDLKAVRAKLNVELVRETCDWLTEPIVEWYKKTVRRAVRNEFDKYIQAGDLEKTKERLEKVQQQADSEGGFVGMYL